MQKCGVKTCLKDGIGGFREIIKKPSINNPFDAELGQPTAWCEEHEEILRELTTGKEVVYLNLEQLAYLSEHQKS